MPTVRGRKFPYTAAGIAKANMLRATPTMGKPVTAGKPTTAGSKTAPSSNASAMAKARSHGQRGAEMKALHASTPAGTPPAAASKGVAMKAAHAPTKDIKVGIPEKGKMAKGRRVAG